MRGLLVMSYGSPASPDDIEDYYTHIRRGRPPSPEQLAELRGRYEAIGGISPLVERTRSQAAALAAALEEADAGGWLVGLGNKHSPPYIEDGLAELAEAGVREVIGLVLAPHFSKASVGGYHERATAAAGEHSVRYRGIESWHDEPAWLDLQADGVRAGLEKLPASAKVFFTAHSLPERVLADDPYADNLRASASAIAERAGLRRWAEWSLVWQSAGRTPEPWRGPDILQALRELAATGGTEGVLVCPQGFVSDHLEILYDLDIEAARVAAEVGLAFARTASVNDDPEVMEALADRVQRSARP